MSLRVAHVITGLEAGGSETMLYKLLGRIDRAAFPSEVISLTDEGRFGPRIRDLGITVRSLGMSGSVPDPFKLPRLAAWLKASRPDIVHCWMYHGNLVGGIAARLAGVRRVLWSIRQTNVDSGSIKRRTILVAKAGAWLSRLVPDAILANAEVSRRGHVALGYDAARFSVIPNGFDLGLFRPDPAARSSVRAELGFGPDTPLIGLIARFDVQKDHGTFLRAAGLLSRQRPEVRFLLAGGGVSMAEPQLAAWAGNAGIVDRCRMLGHRDDVPRLTAALDVATSSSLGEGFANAIGEAMASAVPCVVTDCGDSAEIVGDCGIVVPVGDAAALAAGWERMLEAGAAARLDLGSRARQRIERDFSLEAVTRRHEDFYRKLAA
ncbi:MAG: glycosyltransferase [Alphaproteobacteria bacterium]|nr:glycosyltransferase [Alphaproteobacteria bacterium]